MRCSLFCEHFRAISHQWSRCSLSGFGWIFGQAASTRTKIGSSLQMELMDCNSGNALLELPALSQPVLGEDLSSVLSPVLVAATDTATLPDYEPNFHAFPARSYDPLPLPDPRGFPPKLMPDEIIIESQYEMLSKRPRRVCPAAPVKCAPVPEHAVKKPISSSIIGVHGPLARKGERSHRKRYAHQLNL